LANAHAPSKAVQTRDGLRFHVHAENPRKGNGGICAHKTSLDGVQNTTMVESRSRSSKRMRLELDHAGFHIMSLWPARLLVDELRRVIAVHVVSRVALAGRILALVLIAHTSATGHFAIAFALPLTTWVCVSGWGCLVGLNRSQQAEDSHGAQAALLR
jgi:hypothetical protein